MKKFRSAACLLLAVLTLLCAGAFASCAGGEAADTTAQAENGSTAAETVETGPQFAEADYGGESFTVYMRGPYEAAYMGMYIYCPENATDLVNEQTAIRNAIVEDKYNIKFEYIESKKPRDTISTDLASGNVPYQIILDQRNALRNATADGLLRNFNELDLDYAAGWWDENAYDSYSFAGKIYIMPNDVSVSNLAGCRFYYFNKEVLENFNLTSPYEYAAANNWTIDTFFEMVRGVSAPGPEGQLGVYGLADESGSNLKFMLTGIGSLLNEVGEDGNITCKIGTDYAEKTQSYFDKFRAVTEDSAVCIDFNTAERLDAVNSSNYTNMFHHARALFSQGHFLFIQTSMGGSSQFEDMPKGFGVIMNPKYNADQERYYHQIDNNALIWALPRDAAADLDMIANVMDFWAYTSSGTVVEAYYELTLKTKRASDPTTAEMLDIVKDSIQYYITDIFKADTNSFVDQAYKTSVSAAWRSYSRKLPEQFKDIQETIDAIE